ncbi:DUF4215 domain-containing protein [Nannocystis pusilla]|uniref:Peptidase C-terminal archaeal/bacterial domain-containing protein n=1 Tax=Nannocystis pusilla TaxID=889268 RepID=A0ABS7U1E6_9BACT|nr:DUF4215 domain-containing protein [Nannocystis pusilla]MBZ5714274.1 hypothetical protein [Nannocystis pusilla]
MRRNALSTSLFAAIATLSACGDDGTATTDTTPDTSTTTDASTTSPDPTTGVPTTTDPSTTTTTGTTEDTDTTPVTATETTTTTTDPTTDTTATTETTTDTDTDTDTDTTNTTAPLDCGNGVLDDGEVCDGAELGGQDCAMQGFDDGTLGCAADCSEFDVSQCVLATCGDETIEGAEQCDGAELGGEDCVSQGFSGGELACTPDSCVFDTSACFACGDNAIQGDEVCDGTDLAGKDCVSEGFESGTLGCAADCAALDTSMCATCGDGVLGGDEQCDGAALGDQTCATQGADFGTLGCTAECGFDLSGCVTAIDEVEPNDDAMVAIGVNDFSTVNAQGPFTGDALIEAAIQPAGDDDIYAVQNTGANPVVMRLETFGAGGPGTCQTIDTVIEVRNAANQLLEDDDQDGINSCSLITNFVVPPGETLYVRVIDWQDNGAIAKYFLDIRLNEVACGDGELEPGEQCDDGNAADGDGCSATCQVDDATAEIEPNNTNAEADATGLVSNGTSLYTGSITPNGDLDRYRVDLAAASFVRVESFTAKYDCNAAVTTTLTLFNSNNTQIISDTTSGIGSCSAVVFPLPAGTTYVQLGETGNNAAIADYLLESVVLADAGTETEPNETSAAASLNIQDGSDVFVFGDHSTGSDSDYYRIDVPVSGSSLRLEVIEGDRTVETCESNGIDSELTLFNAQGVEIANDDDDGRGFCSLIDGTGSSPLDTGAHGLAAGTYYVQVKASDAVQNVPNSQFIYRLAATIRKP